jgi:hypothetical protein
MPVAMSSVRRIEVLPWPARSSGSAPADQAGVAGQGRRRTGHSVAARAACALRVLLLLPVAVCVLGAWLAAMLLAMVWAVLVPPFRRNDRGTLD